MLDTEQPVTAAANRVRAEVVTAMKMGYDVFASPVAVPEEWRDTMIGIRFDSKMEALQRIGTLHRAGWHVYRVAGPGGFEMTETLINQFISSLSRPGVSNFPPD